MATTIVYVYHGARDERTTLALPDLLENGDSLKVKNVRELARDRFNQVFGSEEHSYTVDKMTLTVGENSFRSVSLTLRDEDDFWRVVPADTWGPLSLSCKGDILGADDEEEGAESDGSGDEEAPAQPKMKQKLCFKIKEEHSEKVLIPDDKLKQALRGVINVSGLYKDKDVEIPLEQMFAYHSRIVKGLKGYDENGSNYATLKVLSDWLSEEMKNKRAHVDKMLADGVIAFWDLWQIFSPETLVVTTDDDIEHGYRVLSVEYQKSWQGLYFEATAEYVVSNGKEFFLKTTDLIIPAYGGVRDIENLSIRLPTAEQTARLTERGRQLAEHSSGYSYKHYSGIFRVPQGWRPMAKLQERGDVMVDIDNYNRASNTGYGNDFFVGDKKNSLASNNERNIGDDDVLFTFYPWFPAFSFRKKRWGLIAWELARPIVFNHAAFDALVMKDEGQKNLVRGLVKQRLLDGTQVSEDLISGKGGGCIFLLYGPPGTGKTLTAEATAQLLERPLYQITVAELGTDAGDLEAGLDNALRLASHWKAVVLMDEADNFLEKRGKNDLERNAMVSVFLRLLEYYEGVLFLTTNRVEEFDPAFYSRISMPILYPALTKDVRRQVWENLLTAANVELGGDMTLEALSGYNLNGREIRSCIYLAQCTAQFNEGDPLKLSSTELLTPIQLKLTFREAMEHSEGDSY